MTPWSVLLAYDNPMLHDTFEAKSPTLKKYWSLMQAGLSYVNAHTMKPVAVTHDANNQPVKAAPKLNLRNELQKLKRDSVAVVEANKATTHLDFLLTAAPFGLFEEARPQNTTIPILSTTQIYRFTSQVYSTFPLWYTCPLISFCLYSYTEATSGESAFTNGSSIH